VKLYVSQLAWLHAAFEDKSRSMKVARLFSIKNSGGVPELPPLSCASYLLNFMHKIGFPMASEGYVKHTEIKCWCDTQGITLDPDEHQIIFDSFIDYNSRKAQFESDQDLAAPFTTLTADQVKYNKAMIMKSRLGSLKANV